MIYPIVAYGDPVLRKQTEEVKTGTKELKKLVEDMFDTMYHSHGVGLAAPQIGISKRVFVMDASELLDEGETFKKAFVNPEIIEDIGDDWAYEEGCLSIPGVREDVKRAEALLIRYQDVEGNEYEEEYEDIIARVIQHEYDHLEGILFTDYLSGLKKRLIKGKLNNISKGKVDVSYQMKFPL